MPKASYSQNFEEYEAFTAMNMKLSEYEALPGIGFWTDEENPLSKCDVVIWYRYHLAIERMSMGIV